MDIIITEADNEAKDYCNIEIEDDGLIRNLVSQICEVLLDNEKSAIEEKILLNLSIWQTYGINEKKISYINALNRFGLLNHNILDEKKYYFFSFNLLQDYCFAKYIINKYKKQDLLKEYITKDLLQIKGNTIKKITNIPICSMVCAIFSDKYKELDLSFLNNLESQSKHYFADSYVDTYKWRKHINSKQFVEFVKTFKPNNRIVLEMLIENAVKINNPLNSLFLHENLVSKKMAERDYYWTIFINSLTEQNQIYNYIIGIKGFTCNYTINTR